eukprot:10567318-Ditylum_brightwellii.AAC.1
MARPTTTTLVASDGSASEQENTMPFGWVTNLLDSTILATHSGPRYTQLTLACNVSIYIDNKGIVTWVTDQIEYEYDYPYNTLEPDWDVFAQLAQYLRTLGPKLKVAHAKSHQNENYDFDQLNLPAQLNVQADELASAYKVNF